MNFDECIAVLLVDNFTINQGRPRHSMIMQRDQDGLVFPSAAVIEIYKFSEQIFRSTSKYSSELDVRVPTPKRKHF